MDFYPSIMKKLPTKSINYAKSIVIIEEEVITTIFQARKSLLFDKTSVWVKKDNSDFDVTLGNYDGAEVCELVGLYLLDLLTNEFGKHNMFLKHVSHVSKTFQAQIQRKEKRKCVKYSKKMVFTVECNLAITDFLDITFDLKSGTHCPYRKQNNEMSYINKQSNHPPSIIKQIPSMISKRVSDISCDSDHFNKAAPDYSTALKKKWFQ